MHWLYGHPFVLLLCCPAITNVAARSFLPRSCDLRHPADSGTQGSWLYRTRNAIIESIWPLSPVSDPRTGGVHATSRSNPPAKLLARYGGDIVLRFEIKSSEEVEALAEAAHVLFLDVWESNAKFVDVRISKDVVHSLLGLLPKSLQTAHTPLMHDLAQAIYESYPSLAFRESSASPAPHSSPFSPTLRSPAEETNIFFRQYQPLSVITPWMRLLRSLFPTHVRLIQLGISYEGREIQALRVGVHPTNDEAPSEPRKTIIVSGGSHAREWISTSTVTYVAYSFITAYGRDRDITKLLERFDFIFIPTLNPDGYAYTWESDRLWKKNRQKTSLRFCTGIDLDRSYDFEWDSDVNKNNPCSENYPGEVPFEAVEARRLVDWAKNETTNNNVEIAGFLDLHSYSQQVLYPYSYSCIQSPPTLENLEELAIGLAKAIRTTSGEIYGVTAACEGSAPVVCEDGKPSFSRTCRSGDAILEAAGGSALDYFYHELKVPYTYQLKLRDTGSYGFLLPSDNIIPTGKEASKAVRYFASFLTGNKGIEDSEAVKGSIHDAAKLTHPKDQAGFEESEWIMIDDQDEDGDQEIDNVAITELKRRRRR
ncbi:uncharacterized protein KY384_003224 [Bacidia gigantensis]|uniref:uncharacterized protein n=1 Tax=Bacidia gigantensis TaxID=2732470 RepID=UPI001D040BA3|nr:uncharacterized protein KY384_003224 [Bacidia gigantensis]KAG8531594.1 hypothetical protein KY384_003224 [Bacidia gigantensis]